ncbi:MAG: ABC transporter permease [Acidobacteria bacterium]|nr:ABC transporter permease [Acidobacteriota bacterium]
MIQLTKEIFEYRELIWALTVKELRVRYKRSFLGFFWALLNPLLMMSVYVIVFSTILGRGIENYAIFMISGLFPWTFFSQSLNYSMSSIVGNHAMLKKVKFAKSVLPVSAVLSNVINFLLSLLPMAIIILLFRYPFYWTWAYLPVPILSLIIFSLGVGLFCATLHVFFRDMTHIIEILTRAWFFLTPIIYTLDYIPAQYHIYFKLNPMYYILDGFRMAIYYGRIPATSSITMSFVYSFASLVFGYFIFRRYQDKFILYL